MLLKIVRFLRRAAIEAKGERCPKCRSTNTDRQGGIWHCYECGHEW
jgi:ribosomal protein L37AE/L43A